MTTILKNTAFKELLGDNKLIEILAQSHSSEEISALRESVNQDRKLKEAFENANQVLAKYFREQTVSAGTA